MEHWVNRHLARSSSPIRTSFTGPRSKGDSFPWHTADEYIAYLQLEDRAPPFASPAGDIPQEPVPGILQLLANLAAI